MKSYLTFALLAISILPACNSLQSNQEEQKIMGNQCEQLSILYNKNSTAKLAGKSSYLTTIKEGNEGNCQNSIKMLNLDLQGKCTNLSGGLSFACNN
ncbi:MAG: hypothetical protein AABZ74_11020 [Cyanobacteriota bacterium]